MAENINWTTLYFPSNERCIAEFEILNEKLEVQLKADLKKEIYTQNKIKEKEIAIVEYLSKLKKLKEEVLTPESDVYVTPESSPTDIRYSFGHTRCASDSGLSSLIQTADSKYLSTTNTLYYSLVTVEEVYTCESADILEKELAEQDQLFKSFKSIISREAKSTKSDNKTLILTSPLSRPYSQNNHKHCHKSGKNSKKIKGLDLKLNLKTNFKDCGFRNFENTLRSQNFKNVVNSSNQERSLVYATLQEEAINACSSGKLGSVCDGPNYSGMSAMSKRQETDECMEAESVGPDSCLEAGSSGYLTGSSPRDHTTSDAFGGDLTEIATSEDIPHDNDQSARSSSMSSDAGTWDSTFPPCTEAAIKENYFDDNLKKKHIELGDHDSNLSITSIEKIIHDPFAVHITNSVQSNNTARSNGIKHFELGHQQGQCILSSNISREYFTDNLISSQNDSYPLENENTTSKQNCCNSNEESYIDNKDSRLLNGKNNFFIDAASLLDESELSSIPTNAVSSNEYESSEVNGFPSWAAENRKVDNSEINKCEQRDETDCNTNEKVFVEQSDLERRRASLIRRNTFELELDDERLAVLRNEYERHKDKVLHHNNVSSSQGTTPCDGFQQYNSLPINHTEDYGDTPNSLPVALNPFSCNQKCEDDMHSPDSLNNDGPLENPFEKSLKKGNPSYSLPYEVNEEITIGEKDQECNQVSFDVTSQKNVIPFENNEVTYESNTSSGFSSTNNIFKGNTQALNKIESVPIISGGVSLKDLSPEKPISSPLMNRRKAECAPIVSGGSVIELEPENEQKPRMSGSFASSWIVDMSEPSSKSPPEIRGKELNDTASSLNSCDSVKSEEVQRANKMSSSSLGFFISLDDPYDEKSSRDSGYKSSSQQLNKNVESVKNTSKVDSVSSNTNLSNCSSSCGFYVDLSDSHTCTDRITEKESSVPDKKLFSMFIDIGETGGNDGSKSKTSSPHVFKKRTHTRTFSGVFPSKRDDKNRLNDSQMSSESSLEMTESPEVSKHNKPLEKEALFNSARPTSASSNCTAKSSEKTKKQGFYMFIEADPSPVPQRRTLPSGLQPTSQRHSWNFESNNAPGTGNGNNCDSAPRKAHRRSHSVSVNKSLEVMFNVEQNENKNYSDSPLIKGSTSNSIGYESGPSSIDETAYRSSNKSMMASWHGSVKPSAELQKRITKNDWKEPKENKANSVIKSPLDSRTDIVDEMCESFDRSEEIAYGNNKGDDVFDLSNASNESSNTGAHNSTFIISDVSNVANATSSELELTTPTCDIASQLSKDDSDKTETDFDDGEKKSVDVPRTPDHSISQVEIPPAEHKFSFVKLSDMDKEPKKIPVEGKTVVNRMSRSIPEASWIESKMMTRSATSRSLSRLFPHLNTSARNLTPDSGDHETDFSEISSMQSSMDPSALDYDCVFTTWCYTEGSTEETDASSGTGGPVSRLGEDLLRMFLDEISPDVTVEVGGRRIKAHKCILSSRCQYFAAILSGGWVESAGNVISLQGFSYNAVHFALCHIYSGASNIPDSINIVELATLADMLCLEGLKEVIMYTLKVKYCHFFHKPCPMCTVGVLECLPLAAAYGLDEIYRKSLRWITKYFVRVWPTKGFATLPRELLDKCYKQHIVHMTVDNVLETVLCCSKLQGLIPNVRWAEPVFTLATKLYEAAVKFIAQHFCDILSSDVFMSLGKEQLWTMSHLEETLLSAAEKLPPDQACKCHSHLYKLTNVIHSTNSPMDIKFNEGFVEFLSLLATTVEACLLKQAARASRTPAWTLMEPQLRHKIQDAACLVIVPGDDRRRARHLLKRGETTNVGKRPTELVPVKTAVTDSTPSKKTLPARPPPISAVKPKTPQPPVKTESTGPRPKTWPYKISEVKSRYLEPKATPKQSPALTAAKPEKTTPTTRRNVSKSIISSSDSSRTSSPAMRRSLPQRPSRSVPGKREDTLTMSTDSLADPSTSGNKKKSDSSTGAGRGQSFSRVDFVEKNVQSLYVKSGGMRVTSGETVSRVSLSDAKSKAMVAARVDGDRPKYSPVPLSKRSSTHSSPRIKDSPVPQVKSTVNSTPSPSLRRNTLSPKEKSSSTADTKSSLLKRTSTYRVQAKSSSPMKVPATKPRDTVASPNVKGNINKIQSKVNSVKKSAANNNILSNHKTETKPQPMVGSRSGTFLKDEPTVLKKPQVVNVSE
uniref:BTB domain-containing protein n=1 Tax=Cuerna arida TaxID=1464854 RepID=A0A1B6FU43_9HEMI